MAPTKSILWTHFTKQTKQFYIKTITEFRYPDVVSTVSQEKMSLSLVKEEMNIAQLCHGCLSSNRRTAPLGDNSGLYFSVIGPLPYSVHGKRQARTWNNLCYFITFRLIIPSTMFKGYEDVKVCWECRAMLRKFNNFQDQLKTAQHMLLQTMLYQVGLDIIPLSKLSITKKDCFDYEINHLDTLPGTTNPFTLIVSPPVIKPFTVLKENVDLEKVEPEIDSKEIELQNITVLTTTVKVEHTSDDNTQNDDYSFEYNDYYTKDLGEVKEEKPMIENVKKKKNKEKSVSLVTKYRKYTRLIKSEKKDWGDNVEQYFTKARLSEEEMEEHFKQTDRTQRGYMNAAFKCKDCKKGYMKVVDFYRHNDLNHHKPNTPYECKVCKTTLTSLPELAEHWRSHCNLYECNMCGDHCKPRYLKRHLNQQHTKVYGCANCRMEFGSLKKFAHHYKEAHGTFICDYCNKQCSDKKIIEKHITRRHIGHHCAKCNRSFKNYAKYRDHLRLYHPKQLYKNANLELAYCVECDRQYPSVYKYKIHIKESPKHTPKVPGEPILCPECGKSFSRKSYMNNHYRHSHLKVTKYYCELCNKYYANGYGLRQHRESVHLKLPKMKDKICDICGRGFHTNGVLIKHRRTHTGERPYQCGFCSAAFAQITACKTHARTQHRHMI